MKTPNLFEDRAIGRTRLLAEDMSEIVAAVAGIRVLADAGLKRARNAYVAKFGFEFNDRRVAGKVAELFSAALVNGTETVQVPIHIVLALWLQEGGGGRKVGPLPEAAWYRDRKRNIVQKARDRKLELQRQGYKAGPALEIAAQELSPGPEFPPSAIIERIRHPSGKKRKKTSPATSPLPRNPAE